MIPIATVFSMAVLATPPPPADDACRCAAALLENGWCQACGVGYVAGVRIDSALLFEELDAHGHHIDPQRIECPECRAAMKTDGYCQRCQYGYVARQLYFSKLSYYLARGQSLAPSQVRCPVCRKHAAEHGWCPTCKRGMVGPFAYAEREMFENAVREYDRLQAAVAKSKECEMCAVVMFTGGSCPKSHDAPVISSPSTRPSVGPQPKTDARQ